MYLEYKIDELNVENAWLTTLYDMIEELNCKCQTYIDETYNRSNKNFDRMRTIKIYGSDTMLSWFKLRMERYTHFIFNFNEQPDIKSAFSEQKSNIAGLFGYYKKEVRQYVGLLYFIASKAII